MACTSRRCSMRDSASSTYRRACCKVRAARPRVATASMSRVPMPTKRSASVILCVFLQQLPCQGLVFSSILTASVTKYQRNCGRIFRSPLIKLGGTETTHDVGGDIPEEGALHSDSDDGRPGPPLAVAGFLLPRAIQRAQRRASRRGWRGSG